MISDLDFRKDNRNLFTFEKEIRETTKIEGLCARELEKHPVSKYYKLRLIDNGCDNSGGFVHTVNKNATDFRATIGVDARPLGMLEFKCSYNDVLTLKEHHLKSFGKINHFWFLFYRTNLRKNFTFDSKPSNDTKFIIICYKDIELIKKIGKKDKHSNIGGKIGYRLIADQLENYFKSYRLYP